MVLNVWCYAHEKPTPFSGSIWNVRFGQQFKFTQDGFIFIPKSNYMTNMLCSSLDVWIQLLWQINVISVQPSKYSILWSVCFAGSNQCSMSVDSKRKIYLHAFQMIPMEVLRLSSWCGISSTVFLEWFNRVRAGLGILAMWTSNRRMRKFKFARVEMLSIRPSYSQRVCLCSDIASLKPQYGDLIEQPFYQELVTRGYHKFLDIM